MARLRLDSVRKEYGRKVVAVEDLTLDVADGELVALLGPSGCGKSTALRIVAGLEEPTGGDVWIDDRRVTELPAGRRNIAMVFQGASVFPHLTVAANLGFGLRLRHVGRQEARRRVADIAEVLGIADLLDRKPDQISGGERQRVAIGRALLRDADAFLLDEPLSGLDAQIRVQLRAELARIHRTVGTTMLYVTHDQSEALALADRVAVMRDGRLEQVDAPGALYDAPRNRFVAGFVGSPPMHFVEASVDASVDAGALVVLGHRLPPPAGGLDGLPEGSVVLGLRPGDVDVGAPSAPGALPAVVESDEPVGDDRILVCQIDAGDGRTGPLLAARVHRTHAVRTGDPVGLVVDPSRYHLFDAAGGEALL